MPTPEVAHNIAQLKLMVRGAYDLQKLRIQCGLRLCANFRAKLKAGGTEPEKPDDEELSEEAKKILKMLKVEYGKVCEGIARNRTLPDERKFIGTPVISSFAEATLCEQYFRLESQEDKHFRQLEAILEKIPIYTDYLSEVTGIGPAMAAVLITYLDPAKARHVSSFWRYAGLDLGPDGRGISRRQEHLVERKYIDKNGKEKVRMGVTFNPFLKTKLLGVLAGSFLRSGSEWRTHYDRYRHRIESDDRREKCTIADWKKRRLAGEDVIPLWPPGRVHQASGRVMVKAFLANLWDNWRKLEGLPVTPTYNEARRGYLHHGEAAE